MFYPFLALERVLLWLVRGGIFLIFLTPLVITGSTLYPSLFPKAIYFRVVVEIVFLLYLFLVLVKRSYLPKVSPVFISVLVFIEILALATWRSINSMRSFWGTIERMEGFILFLHLFLFFVVLVGVFRNRKDWIWLLRLVVLVSIPMGAAAIAQKLKILSFFVSPDEWRVSSTIGNPIFYAAYLIFIIFLAMFLCMVEQKKVWKILFCALAGSNFLLLLLTGTRGAWIGLGLGIGALGTFWFFALHGFEKRERRYALLFGIFFILLFFLLFLVFSNLGYLPHNNLLTRYEDLWQTAVELKNPRILVWQLGLDAWKDSPIFGYGLESFSYIYDTYYQARLLKAIPESIFFDRAHNKPIDILVESGIIGLAGYLSVFGVAIFMVWRHRKERFGEMASFVFIALLLSYFTQNVFALDTITPYVMFFFVLGFIDVNFRPSAIGNGVRSPQVPLKNVHQGIVLWSKIVFALLAFLLVAAAVFLVNIRSFKVGSSLAEVHHLLGMGEASKAFDVLEHAFAGPGFTRFETYYYGIETVFFALPLPKYQGSAREFSQELLKIAKPMERYLEGKAETLHMRGYFLLAQIYQTLYSIEPASGFLEDEERILGKMLKLNTQFPNVYRLAGKMRFLQQRQEEGMVMYAKAYELDQNISKFYEWVGISYRETGEKRKGIEALRKSLEVGDFYTEGKFNLEKVWQIAGMYEELGDLRSMAAFYEYVLKRSPGSKPHPQIFASLSKVYALGGDNERARQATATMVKLYPELRSRAEEFLSTLEK